MITGCIYRFRLGWDASGAYVGELVDDWGWVIALRAEVVERDGGEGVRGHGNAHERDGGRSWRVAFRQRRRYSLTTFRRESRQGIATGCEAPGNIAPVIISIEKVSPMPNMIARARRAARSVDLIASRSRSRHISPDNLGGFMLSDENNCVVEGANYDLSAEDVIASCCARRGAAA